MTKTPIVITLIDAHHFYCQEDEEHFFGWLEQVPAVQSVRGWLQNLDVSIAAPFDDQSLRTLLGLFARYGLNGAPLQALCTPENEGWFREPGKHWFASVFSSAEPATVPDGSDVG
jgi:hypothetical protein